MRLRAVLWAGLVIPMAAQSLGDLAGSSAKSKSPGALSYAAEPATVAAGRQAVVEVRLQVREGLHVNSHRPKSDLLIPTVATLEAADAGVKVGAVEYPAGESYRFATDPAEALDVYTGAVMLRVPVVAAKGEHTLRGTVRYQACNDRSCFPPQVLGVAVPFTAR